MGNGLVRSIRGERYRQVNVEAVKHQLEEKGILKKDAPRPTERLAFYGRPMLKHKDQINKLVDLDWFDFLMHTELCTMNYDALTLTDDQRFDHMVRMMENLKVPQTLRKPAKDLMPLIYDLSLIHISEPTRPY